ncbi:hypothetical protein NOR_02957 [Metarhizium rileyi]|uniref:Uncharacterized protein n=1 Tax=Metarhizium rileyi (strain RCEF 4871) TaxID=1649241 RepID=A0A167G644_METRR|nr:hypothetical protein NOR_02957 [Metarhizium rileyi RCEF 4871]TWU78989.1 hypothetical protein ED733_008274 [Metarhizium rileyi]
MPDKPPPLPVAADHLAISNRLSMLLADRSSLVKKLVPARTHTRAHEDVLLLGSPANQGVGYVPEATANTTNNTRQDAFLRGKLLGGRRLGAVGRTLRSRRDGSESDEEEGRGSLGKRKRPRKARDRDVDRDVNVDEIPESEAEAGAGDALEGVAQTTEDKPKRKKRRKNKNKNDKVEGGRD